MSETTVATTDSQTPARFDPGQLISEAIASNVPVETMERLLAMRTQLKAEAAREAYFQALAQFQGVCPIIIKNAQAKGKGGTNTYKYAPLDEIVIKVRELLRDHGFSYQINTEDINDRPHAVVTGIHSEGHTERSIFPIIEIKGTQIMNEIQVWAASQMYAKRYAFCNLWGIMTGDRDDDGAPPRSTDTLTDPQYMALNDLIASTGTDIAKFLKWGNVANLSELPQSRYDEAHAFLKRIQAGETK